MGKGRLEAFSDGVLAILITIMVLELRAPRGEELASLAPLWPALLSYVLSFIYLAIYWNNHHHLLHTVHRVTGSILWANLHLLFWLSLVPFTTAWMGSNHFAPTPVALYGGVLILAAVAYFILQGRIIASQGEDSVLRRAIGRDVKGKASLILYTVAIVASIWEPRISLGLYFVVALMWLVPDRRIESVLLAR
jgi:uncharacterized membrane protein